MTNGFFSGSGEMLPAVIVGTAKSPLSFRRNGWREIDVEKQGFHYFNNPTAWMNREIFDAWVGWLNDLMVQQNRSVILLLDNFRGHQVPHRSNVRLEFLPPNTTSKLQPLDAGIIKSFKDHFKTCVAETMMRQIFENKSAEDFSKSIEIYDAVAWAVKSVNDVKKTTIVNCFGHCHIREMSQINLDDTELSDCVENVEISAEIAVDVADIVDWVWCGFKLWISFIAFSFSFCELSFINVLYRTFFIWTNSWTTHSDVVFD